MTCHAGQGRGKVILVGRPRQPLNQRADIVSFLTFHFGFCQVLPVFPPLASVLRVLLRTKLGSQTKRNEPTAGKRDGVPTGTQTLKNPFLRTLLKEVQMPGGPRWTGHPSVRGAPTQRMGTRQRAFFSSLSGG